MGISSSMVSINDINANGVNFFRPGNLGLRELSDCSQVGVEWDPWKIAAQQNATAQPR